MSDEHSEELEPSEPAETEGDASEEAAEQGDKHGRPGHEGHSLKRELREGVAKAAGFAVQVGSILGQQGGEIVEAEKTVAEEETEDFLDRVDGED
ncbi:MAG: hypothetical protein HY876_01515 [Coriobacteriales bacterium]|nr:hypothetical protein [Coriobacteriales bacterium]